MKIEEKSGKFLITDFDELEAYKVACKIEKDGIDFYQNLLEKTSEEKIKETLKLLLAEERKHLNIFDQAQAEMEKAKENSLEDEDLLNSMDYGIFQPYQSIDELNKVLNNPQKALKLGIIIEDKSINFYQICQEKVSSQKTKAELGKIIQQEQKHKKTFEEILNNL